MEKDQERSIFGGFGLLECSDRGSNELSSKTEVANSAGMGEILSFIAPQILAFCNSLTCFSILTSGEDRTRRQHKPRPQDEKNLFVAVIDSHPPILETSKAMELDGFV